jgi:hypothetical protein
MSHEFCVLHFGRQCPWYMWVIEQARQAANQTASSFEAIDISERPDLAALYGCFFPLITVIDKNIRVASPTPAKDLVGIASKRLIAEPTVYQPAGPQSIAERVELLSAANMQDTCCLCIPESEEAPCLAKKRWATMIEHKMSQSFLGFIAYNEDQPAAVAELLPSTLVPYPLPEKKDFIALITCLYSTSEMADLSEMLDYRGFVLNHLLECLPKYGYKKVQIISGRRTAYPNGPAPFLHSYGFKEVAELDQFVLKIGREELLLMEFSF